MTRPWEYGAPRPWENQQPVYDRAVTIRRLKTEAGPGPGTIGEGGYSGPEQGTGAAGEVVILGNSEASIQQKQAGRTSGGLLPTDIAFRPLWAIYIPAWAPVAKGYIRDRDIVTDDEGYRYGVMAARWDVFGYRLSCVRLEV
jgi:hypothetical protein